MEKFILFAEHIFMIQAIIKLIITGLFLGRGIFLHYLCIMDSYNKLIWTISLINKKLRQKSNNGKR